jgi:hypothetical protein
MNHIENSRIFGKKTTQRGRHGHRQAAFLVSIHNNGAKQHAEGFEVPTLINQFDTGGLSQRGHRWSAAWKTA